jgi:hypoxanthine phosphoribosyltransferase
MERIFGRPIVTQEEMRARIRELGTDYTEYTGRFCLGGSVEGVMCLHADLVRAIKFPCEWIFLW